MHLLNDVKTRMANGTIQDCLATQTINEMPKSGLSDLAVAYAISSPFGAGIETVRLGFRPSFKAVLKCALNADCWDALRILP